MPVVGRFLRENKDQIGTLLAIFSAGLAIYIAYDGAERADEESQRSIRQFAQQLEVQTAPALVPLTNRTGGGRSLRVDFPGTPDLRKRADRLNFFRGTVVVPLRNLGAGIAAIRSVRIIDD